jgi:hypothetical protein
VIAVGAAVVSVGALVVLVVLLVVAGVVRVGVVILAAVALRVGLGIRVPAWVLEPTRLRVVAAILLRAGIVGAIGAARRGVARRRSEIVVGRTGRWGVVRHRSGITLPRTALRRGEVLRRLPVRGDGLVEGDVDVVLVSGVGEVRRTGQRPR